MTDRAYGGILEIRLLQIALSNLSLRYNNIKKLQGSLSIRLLVFSTDFFKDLIEFFISDLLFTFFLDDILNHLVALMSDACENFAGNLNVNFAGEVLVQIIVHFLDIVLLDRLLLKVIDVFEHLNDLRLCRELLDPSFKERRSDTKALANRDISLVGVLLHSHVDSLLELG
jgi:flagellar biosynthesis protein FlhB